MKNERRKRKNERVEVGQYGYLYRGYPIGKNGAERKNWVYGELITVFGGTKIICREGGEIHIYDVVPTSVGRRTGLVDVLGTAIFEGVFASGEIRQIASVEKRQFGSAEIRQFESIEKSQS